MLSESRLYSLSKSRKDGKAIRLDFVRGWAQESGVDTNLGSQREPRGLGSSLRRFGIGRYEGPILGLSGTEVGDADTQSQRAQGLRGPKWAGKGFILGA